MHKLVLFMLLLALSFPFSTLAQGSSINETRYRIEVFVGSSKARLIEIDGKEERIVSKFPVGTAQKKYFGDIPFGKNLPVTKIVANPPWIPTQKMYKDEQAKLAKGIKIPKPQRLREFKPGEPGNPLGRIAFYFDNPYTGQPIRFHGTSQEFKTQVDDQGEVRGFNVSRGCVRNELANLISLSRILSGKEIGEIVSLIQSRRYHEIKSQFPISIIFFES